MGILVIWPLQERPLYGLFQVCHSLCGREWTRTKQLSGTLSSHPVPARDYIPHSRLWNHFGLPRKRAPMQKSINSWASTIHTWNERMWWKKEKEYDREEREKYSERGKEGEANRQEDTAKEEKNKNWTGRAKERNKKEKRQMNAEEQGECLEGPSMSLVWTPDRFSTGRHSHRKIKILWLLSHAHRNMHTSYDRH